jgi:hypothetical protein
MKSIELLKKYPLSTEVVREWFIQKMIESVKGDTTVPEDFKNFMIEQGIPNDTLCIFIDSNPRSLFDVFDENDVIIQIIPIKEDKIKYLSRVNQFETPYDFTRPYFTRKEAELFAVEAAFEILEEKLREERMTIIAQNGNTGEHYEEILEE